MEEFVVRYPIWPETGQIDTFSQAWDEICSQLSELGCIKGWIDPKLTPPSYAYLAWQDESLWKSFRKHGEDPIKSAIKPFSHNLLYGYLDPEVVNTDQTVFSD